MALPGQDLLLEKPDALGNGLLVHGSAGAKGAVWRDGQYWQRVFCFSCHCPGPLVPEKNMTFAFWLCNDVPKQNGCYKKYGHLTTFMVMPDEMFWAEVAAEQLEAHGRYLTNQELLDVVAADSSPLATLIKEGRSRTTGG